MSAPLSDVLFANEFQSAVREIGITATLTFVTPGVPDPDTGDVVGGTTTTLDVAAIQQPMTSEQTVQEGVGLSSFHLLVAGSFFSGRKIDTLMRATVFGQVYNVKRTKMIRSKGEEVVVRFICDSGDSGRAVP